MKSWYEVHKKFRKVSSWLCTVVNFCQVQLGVVEYVTCTYMFCFFGHLNAIGVSTRWSRVRTHKRRNEKV